MPELNGWLLDLYAAPQGRLALWLLCEDGERRCLSQAFPITFYAAGPASRLRQLWRFLQDQPEPLTLSRAERRDLFQPEPLAALAVQVRDPACQPGLFSRAAQAFPELDFYDADLAPALHHAAVHGTFPLARLQVNVDERGDVQAIQVLDSPWDLDPEPPPLRSLNIEPDCDPQHAAPRWLILRSGRCTYRLSLQPPRPLLVNLAAILNRHDPDVLLSAWGDTWLLPLLLELSANLGLPLPLNRDPSQEVRRRRERSYVAYGQVIHRGQQVQLFGRWHIDACNALMFHDYGLDGILESARVTALPAQDAARLSPGTGISAMQIVNALRQGVLVPWHKQQVEDQHSALDLVQADQGGLVYQPLTGLHRDVAELDFISMYPSIMARFNISPETIGSGGVSGEAVPEVHLRIDRRQVGLVPQTLQPLLEKRIAFKEKVARLPAWNPRRKVYKARAAAHKWLLVTCFGYLGYKNARFGRIEAHQAVTAYGRECLLRAKEAAEEAGGSVLHLYVDGLWIQLPGHTEPGSFQPLLDEIAARTSLPIALEGIYRWIVFLPSRVDVRRPVANRFFGVYQDGSLKVRGIEARRHDTPAFIAETQMGLLEILARAQSAAQLVDHLPAALDYLRRRTGQLRAGRVPLEALLVNLKISRTLAEYRMPSPAARAAAQLAPLGKHLRPGQHVRLLYLRGQPDVHAWDLPEPPDPARLDLKRYLVLLQRAADTILQPLAQASLPGSSAWLTHERQIPMFYMEKSPPCQMP